MMNHQHSIADDVVHMHSSHRPPPETREDAQHEDEPMTPPALTITDANSSSFLEFSEHMETPPRSTTSRRRRPVAAESSTGPRRPRPFFGDTDAASHGLTPGYTAAEGSGSAMLVPPSPARNAPRSARGLLPHSPDTLPDAAVVRPPAHPLAFGAEADSPVPQSGFNGFGDPVYWARMQQQGATTQPRANAPALLSLAKGDASVFADVPKSPIPLCKQQSHIKLRNQPATPRSLLHRARLGGMQRNNSVVLASDSDDLNYKHANVNPFTPRSNSKRAHKDSYPLRPVNTHKHKKTFSVVSRYKEEFIEERILGKGDFGTVFRCKHKLDGMVYAIKKSRKRIAGLAEEQRLLREVYAHAVLQAQPYIVRYFSAWEEDNRMIIQNEYCDGGTLAKLLEDHIAANKLFREHTLTVILKHLALGTQALHRLKLVHMDIKPANILIKYEEAVNAASAAAAAAAASACNSGANRTNNSVGSGARARKNNDRMSMTSDMAEATICDADTTQHSVHGTSHAPGTDSSSALRTGDVRRRLEEAGRQHERERMDVHDTTGDHAPCNSSHSSSFQSTGNLMASDLESMLGEGGSDCETSVLVVNPMDSSRTRTQAMEGLVSSPFAPFATSRATTAAGPTSGNNSMLAGDTDTEEEADGDEVHSSQQRKGDCSGADSSGESDGDVFSPEGPAATSGSDPESGDAVAVDDLLAGTSAHAANTENRSSNSNNTNNNNSSSIAGRSHEKHERGGDGDDEGAEKSKSDVMVKVSFKLGDLGLVTRRDDRSAEEGDSRYLAREVLRGRYTDLSKADVFSIGCSLYELASLTPLAPNGPQWHRLRDDDPPPLPGYSAAFNRLVLSMLREDPAARPSAVDILRHPLVRPDPESDTKTQLRQALNRVQQLEQELRHQKQLAGRRDKVPMARKQSCVF